VHVEHERRRPGLLLELGEVEVEGVEGEEDGAADEPEDGEGGDQRDGGEGAGAPAGCGGPSVVPAALPGAEERGDRRGAWRAEGGDQGHGRGEEADALVGVDALLVGEAATRPSSSRRKAMRAPVALSKTSGASGGGGRDVDSSGVRR
jgi:hypothetical protein